MNIVFEPMNESHKQGVMAVFNYYIETGTAAFPLKALPEGFYPMLMERAGGYPAYVITDTERGNVAGFCRLTPFMPFQTFSKTACVTYFLAQDYIRKGLGGICLERLEEDAKKMGISHLIAEISSENQASIAFHQKHGFLLSGELSNVGEKLNRTFGIVLMQKELPAAF